MSDSREMWTLESIVEFFREKFIDAEKAIRIARDDINTRLKEHDSSIAKIATDTAAALLQTREREALFHTRSAHEEYTKVIDERFDSLRKEIKPQWIVWVSAAGVFVTATVAISTGIWTLGVQPIKEDIHRVETNLDTHITNDIDTEKNMNDIKDKIKHNGSLIETLQVWVMEHSSMKQEQKR